MVWKGDATGRLAKGLIRLIDDVDAKWPARARHSDGSIGDRAHQARPSDHNPGADGVVEALDITHDPDDNGPDTWALADIMRQNRDPRIDYVISNGRIFAGPDGPQPWVWRKYTGANNHAKHVHVSIRPSLMDDARPWRLEAGGPITPEPEPPKPKGITADMRQRMMKVIMGYEGRIPPRVFIAPDGRPEIAGITQKDHPQKYAELKRLLDEGKTQSVMDGVVAYYLEYTAPAQNWTDRAGPEFFLRDCILNRGPTGAAEILQMALGVTIDHQVGPATRGELAALNSDQAIDKLRAARERYEDKKYPQRRSSNQWQGMLNRWNKVQAQAKAFQKEQGQTFPVKTTIGVGAGGTAAVVAYTFWDWITGHIIPSVIIACGVAAVAVLIIRKIKGD
jgi:hypothetical protein